MTTAPIRDTVDPPYREARTLDPTDVGARIADSSTIAIGGFINSGHPMAFVRQIIRDGRKDLTVVGAASAGLEIDLLIAAECVSTVVTPYVGAEGLAGIGPAFRRAAETGTISVYELDEAHHYAALRAAAQRLPFNPWRAGIGTSLPVVNPDLKEFTDPVNGELLLAIPAREIDVCLLHAAISDGYGNVQHNGTGYGDTALHAAAKCTFVSVEQVVSPERIRSNPGATTIDGATGISRVMFGSHPFSADGFYRPDEVHLREYLVAASDWLKSGSRTQIDDYLGRYVYGPEDHAAYLEAIGIRRLLDLAEF